MAKDKNSKPKLVKDKDEDVHIGIDRKDRKAVAESLSRLLADTYALQLKTQYYHWNVRGQDFNQLHLLFGTQYEEISLAVDEIAERIRALGHTSPGTFREFSALTQIREDKTVPANWQEMIANLLEAHESITIFLREGVGKMQAAGDEGTADLFIGRTKAHDKHAWMLRSHLG